MDKKLPTSSELRQWIKELNSQIGVLRRQVEGFESALIAQTGNKTPRTRNRKKSNETIDLEKKVQAVFNLSERDSLKLVDLMRWVIEEYPEESRPDVDSLRGKFANLKKSGFLVSSPEGYGFYQIKKTTDV